MLDDNAKQNVYTPLAIVFHWTTASLIITLIPLGLYMTGLPLSIEKIELYSWHKWLGLTVLAIAIMRGGWRLTHRPPPLPPSIPLWQRKMADGMHHLLYVLIFIIPLSGWALSSADGIRVVWWGLLRLPNLIEKNDFWAHVFLWIHVGLNYLLMLLLAGHFVAALKHFFIDRDGVLQRMLPMCHR